MGRLKEDVEGVEDMEEIDVGNSWDRGALSVQVGDGDVEVPGIVAVSNVGDVVTTGHWGGHHCSTCMIMHTNLLTMCQIGWGHHRA